YRRHRTDGFCAVLWRLAVDPPLHVRAGEFPDRDTSHLGSRDVRVDDCAVPEHRCTGVPQRRVPLVAPVEHRRALRLDVAAGEDQCTDSRLLIAQLCRCAVVDARLAALARQRVGDGDAFGLEFRVTGHAVSPRTLWLYAGPSISGTIASFPKSAVLIG